MAMSTPASIDVDDNKQNDDPPPYNFNQVNFNIGPNKIQKTKKIYAQQCNSLNSGDQQKDLFKVLAVARYGKIPLLPFLIDAFTRDRVKHYLKHKQLIEIQAWSRSRHYPAITYITKTKKYQNQLEAAMATFSHRYCATMRLPALLRIDDYIESFAQYIVETSNFIQTLFKAARITPPFQIDLLIIPNKVHNPINTANVDDDDDDDDDDFDDDGDDSDSDDDDSSSDDDDNDNKSNDADIGNIKTKLDDKNVIYQYKTLNATGALRRDFHAMYKGLENDHKNKNQPNNNNVNNGSSPLDCRRRICIVIDRRSNNLSLTDDAYMYIPPSGNRIPSGYVPEWFFESSCQCILPSSGTTNITAKTAAGGNVFCLSFHIIEKCDIKCYLYFNGQMMRFLPNDIVDLFPSFFKDTVQNKAFIQKEKISKEKQTKIKLPDPRFMHFRQQTKYKTNKKISKKKSINNNINAIK